MPKKIHQYIHDIPDRISKELQDTLIPNSLLRVLSILHLFSTFQKIIAYNRILIKTISCSWIYLQILMVFM